MFVYTMPDQYYDSGARQSMVPLMHTQYYDSGAMKSRVPLMLLAARTKDAVSKNT